MAMVDDSQGPLPWAIRLSFVLAILSLLFGALDVAGYRTLQAKHDAAVAYAASHEHVDARKHVDVIIIEVHKSLLFFGIGFVTTGVLQIVFTVLLARHMAWALFATLGVAALNALVALAAAVSAVMGKGFAQFGVLLVWIIAIGFLMYLLKQSIAILNEDALPVPGSQRGAPSKAKAPPSASKPAPPKKVAAPPRR